MRSADAMASWCVAGDVCQTFIVSFSGKSQIIARQSFTLGFPRVYIHVQHNFYSQNCSVMPMQPIPLHPVDQFSFGYSRNMDVLKPMSFELVDGCTDGRIDIINYIISFCVGPLFCS